MLPDGLQPILRMTPEIVIPPAAAGELDNIFATARPKRVPNWQPDCHSLIAIDWPEARFRRLRNAIRVIRRLLPPFSYGANPVREESPEPPFVLNNCHNGVGR
jgi:hypothetical protein